FFFFFSSRRRHTRFSRDWSSDVCSSDLELKVPVRILLFTQALGDRIHKPASPGPSILAPATEALEPAMRITGSTSLVPVRVPPWMDTSLACRRPEATTQRT